MLEKFEQYFLPKKNLSYERFKFFTRKQLANESIEQFVTDLKNRASSEIGKLQESLIKDIFTCGLSHISLREKLLQQNNLTMQEAIDLCVVVEKSREQSSVMSTKATVYAVKKTQGGRA